MTVAVWLSPLLSFVGAALGAWLVYRLGRTEEWGRRFQSALDLLAEGDPRQRALGLARLVAISRRGDAGREGRDEALAVLGADVRSALPPDVLRAIAERVPDGEVNVDAGPTRLEGGRVFVGRAVLESALAYVEIAGGPDAATDDVVVLVASASAVRAAQAQAAPQAADVDPALVGEASTLPTDDPLLIVKLTPDAVDLSPEQLRERASKAWRLSLTRLEAEPPDAIVAVAQKRVIGAWEFRDARTSPDEAPRVEFELGAPVPDLVGRVYSDTSQNPVRYWP